MAKFKTRARTVDLLGRQQIADVSTAISELFKNAHDAYAENVEIDYFQSDDLLVIRDDGIGMTRDEFENRWLVLGTESKLSSSAHNKKFQPAGKETREIMGEKGIGRLAIAILGQQVLVLTRPSRDGIIGDLSMCFINWGLFEIPSLNLEDLDFPVVTIEGTGLPTEDEVSSLLAKNIKQVKELSLRYLDVDFSSVLNNMDDFLADPVDLDNFLEGLSLNNSGGTHFIISPANEEMRAEIQREKDSRTKEFTKNLLGFCNSAFCSELPFPLQTAFRNWPTDEYSEELVGSGEFFTKEDVLVGDQHISGEINEYGQFTGNIRVYDKVFENHVISWNKGHGKKTLCGSFKIDFAYLQGNKGDSQADAEDFHRVSVKLDSIGGLYVYRDGIRILPYGNSDIDWLGIELRRNKGLGHYFFSYRRLYGAVCLSRKNNSKLKEKAGREGFQKDAAYRQLTEILENLFIQLAADFYRKQGDYVEHYNEVKGELERIHKAKQKRDQQAGTKKINLQKELDVFFKDTSNQIPETEVSTLLSKVKSQMMAASQVSNPDKAAEKLLLAEKDANEKIAVLRRRYQVARPRGLSLNKRIQEDWDAYKRETIRLEEDVFTPFVREVGESLGVMATEARAFIDQRKRLESLIKKSADTRSKEIKEEARELEKSAIKAKGVAIDTARQAIQEFSDTVKEVEVDFAAQDFTSITPEAAELLREGYETRIKEVGEKNKESLGRVREMLTSIAENLEETADVSHLDVLEAMESELQGLKEQADSDAELVQLGLAVAVINHEFEASIKTIRQKLKELGPWANVNEDLQSLYRDIRVNFDHLDAHLNLFTPLQRRLQRSKISIKGSDLNHYVRTLFKVRLLRHEVTLKVTQEFLDSEVKGFPSTIYPVFVNVIDNAIFWLNDVQENRTVRLDFVSGAYRISNNGPVIREQDSSAIFDQGFSRKPSGRGLGLFISKRALNKDGFDLKVLPPSESLSETTFVITPQENLND